MTLLKIQILSDIHLEFRENINNYKFIKPMAPILVLCGDVCPCGSDEDFKLYKNFIEFFYNKFEHIIHIFGNHEYYTNKKINTMDVIEDKVRNYAKNYPKLHYMNNNIIKFEFNNNKIYIAGTTLWTNVPDNIRYEKIETTMNDYSQIFVKDTSLKSGVRKFKSGVRKFKLSDMICLHNNAVKFLKKSIVKAKKDNVKLIVLTHHKPYISNKENYSPLYEVDMTKIITDPIILWCYGHTHASQQVKINNTHLISNPIGYPYERNVGHIQNFIMEINL